MTPDVKIFCHASSGTEGRGGGRVNFLFWLPVLKFWPPKILCSRILHLDNLCNLYPSFCQIFSAIIFSSLRKILKFQFYYLPVLLNFYFYALVGWLNAGKILDDICSSWAYPDWLDKIQYANNWWILVQMAVWHWIGHMFYLLDFDFC